MTTPNLPAFDSKDWFPWAEWLDAKVRAAITAADVPPPTTNAGALTSGTLPPARIGDGSIADAKLASGTALTAAERTKLGGVAAGATANATDAQLRDRATHTGTQPATSVSGLATVATSGAYGDLVGKPTIPAPTTDAAALTTGTLPPARIGDGSIADAKLAGGTALTAAERTKLSGVAAGATANAADAQLRDRATHTGTQDASTVSGLATVATSGAYGDLVGRPTIPAAAIDLGAVALPGGAYVASGVRRAVMPLSDSNSTAAASARDMNHRTIIRLPPNVTRMRMRFANHNLLASTVLTSPATITSAYIGEPAFATTGPRRWNGNFVAAPTAMFTTPLTVPVDGTDVVGPWFTVPAGLAGRNVLLSWGMTTAATGTGIAMSLSTSALRITSAGSAQAGNTTVSGTMEEGKLFGDPRVEFEVAGPTRVGLFIADSIGAGYSGDYPTEGGTSTIGTLPSERWPDQAARQGNFVAINLGIGSASASQFTTATAMQYSRAALDATTTPDFAVIAIGTNDIGGGYTSETDLIAQVVAACRTLGIQDIYLCTMLPRGLTANVGTLTAAASTGATTLTSSINTGTGEIVVGSGSADYEVATVSAVSGTGPYTLTVGALTKNHAVNSRIAYSQEKNRIRVNHWIRQMPVGIAGVIDFDAIMADPTNPTNAAPQYIATDGLHPTRSGYARMGQAVAALGRW